MRLRAAQWSVFELGLRQGLGLIVSIILARILGPAAFGLVALTAFFAALGTAIVQTALGTILIQQRGCTTDQQSSLFWLNLIASGAIAVLIAAISIPVAKFYHQDMLAVLMPLAALQVLFGAIATVPTALLTLKLDIRPLALIGIAAFLVSGAIAVGMALAGMGVWSLAIQPTLYALVYAVLIWFASDWRPRLHMSLREVAPMLKSGSMISASSALDMAYSQGFALIIGRMFGVQPLGLYNRAQGIQQIPGNLISTVINRLALPIMTQASSERDRLRSLCKHLNAAAVAIAFPAMATLAVLSKPIVLAMFGVKWTEAAPLVVYLALAGALFPMQVINLQVPIVLDRTHRYFQAEVAKKIVGFTCMIAGSFMGIAGLAVSQSIFAVIAFFINAYLAQRMIGYGALTQLRDVAPVALASAVMAGAMLLLYDALAERTMLAPLAVLAVVLLAGGAIYAVLMSVFYPAQRGEVITHLWSAIGGKPTAR
ncbi:MAG: lipopolysaccharide biosynthesis protein [Novosphingobium sp.]